MTYDEMNNRLKENLKERSEVMSECMYFERIPEHINKKMVALFDEFDELWGKVCEIDNRQWFPQMLGFKEFVVEVAGFWGTYILAAKYTVDTPGQENHMKLLNRLRKAKRMKDTE